MNNEQQPPEDNRDSKQIADDVMREVKGESAPAPQPAPKKTAEQKPPATEKKQDAKPEPTDDHSLDISEIPPEAIGEKKPSEPKKTETAKTASDDEPPEIKKADKRTQEAFQRLRTKLEQANHDIEQLRLSKPTDTSTTQVVEQAMQNKKEMEELTAKLNQAYDEIGKYSLAADPRFRAQYDGPQGAVVDAIKDIAKEWDVKDDTIEDILKAGPKKRIELINEVAPDILPLISGHLAQYDHIGKMKQMAIDRHQETRKSLEEQQQQRSTMLNKTARETLFKAASMNVLKSGHFLFTPIEGNEKWNKNVAILQRKVSELFAGDDQMTQAEHLVLGVAAPVYYEWYKKERARRVQLEAEMKERYGTRSGLESTTTDDARNAKPKEHADASDVVSGILAEEMK